MSSSASLLSLATSHPLPLRPPSQSLSPSVQPLPSTSLYVTFKVLQLANTFRKRVKTRNTQQRLRKATTTTITTQHFCQDIERQAYDEIDKYLGRKNRVHARKGTYPEGNYIHTRVAKSCTVATTQKPAASNRLQWLLDEADRAVKSDEHSLTTIAKDHELFITRNRDFHIERLSLKDLTQLLVVVKDLLGTLRRIRPSGSGAKTLAEGNKVLDLTLDETVAANLEHLLLCVKDQLIRLLVSKLVHFVRKQLVECQREQQIHNEEWFFEFPDARHPLSTTWPWSIRPSLAVIWGVCWMFYDCPQDWWSDDYTFPAESERLLAEPELQAMLQQRPQSAQQLHFYQQPEAIGFPVSLRPQAEPHTTRPFSHPHSTMTHQHSPQPPSHQQHRGLTAANFSSPISVYSSSPDQRAVAATSTPYCAAPHSYAYASASGDPNWLSVPEENLDFPASLGIFQANAPHNGADDVALWNRSQLALQGQQQQQRNLNVNWSPNPPANLPPRARHLATPAIRLITDPSQLPQQPQDNIYHSATSVSTNSPFLQPEPAYTFNNYLHPHAHPAPMNPPDEKMQIQHTPPRSPQAQSPRSIAMLGEQQMARKRSHDEMTGSGTEQNLLPENYVPENMMPENPYTQTNGEHHSRSGSVVSQHQELSASEATSPKTKTIRRENPPQNQNGKFYCEYGLEECIGLTFDRKCEWSKHMDKHDRPYRCQNPECAKLQGFTYSGGLLRHEREVHNKHGGPKSALVCPHTDCKRHTGKGFTRKENLNEHIRRVHGEKASQSQSQTMTQHAAEALQSAEEMESQQQTQTPYFTNTQTLDGAGDVEPSPVQKRRRFTQAEGGENGGSVDVVDLQQQLEQLRRENQEKDAQMAAMRARMEEMEHLLQLVQSSTEGQTQGNAGIGVASQG